MRVFISVDMEGITGVTRLIDLARCNTRLDCVDSSLQAADTPP